MSLVPRHRTLVSSGLVIFGELVALLGFFAYVGSSQSASNNYCGTANAYSGCATIANGLMFAYGLAAIGIVVMVLGSVFFIRSGRRRQDKVIASGVLSLRLETSKGSPLQGVGFA